MFVKSKKILLGVGVILALFSILLLSVCAVESTDKTFYFSSDTDAFKNARVYATAYWSQYSDARAFTNYWDTVTIDALPDEYGNINGHGYARWYLWRSEWYKKYNPEFSTDQLYDNAQAIEIGITLPFVASDGTTWEEARLDASNILKKISIGSICQMYGYNVRALDFSVLLDDGSSVPLLTNPITDTSYTFVLNKDVNIPVSDVIGFKYSLKTFGVPTNRDTYLHLEIQNYSYLSVYNNGYKMEQTVTQNNNTIQSNKDKAEQVLNDISVNEPSDADINNIVNHIDDADLSVVNQFGISSIPRSSKFYEFVISASIIFVCLAFCGYMLHGKRG